MRHWNVRYPHPEDESRAGASAVVTILDAPEQQAFRFFDLPAELRDKVYDYLTIDLRFDLSEREQYTTGLSRTFLENGLRPEILLSNRRLSREYKNQVRAQSTLIFEDQFALQYALETPHIWSPNVVNCRVHLTKQCVCPRRRGGRCSGMLHFSDMQLLETIPSSIRYVELEMVHFVLNQAAKYDEDEFPNTIHGWSYMANLQNLALLPRMKRVDLYTFQNRQDHSDLIHDMQLPVPLREVIDWSRCNSWAKHTANWTSEEGWTPGNAGTGLR